MDWFTLIYLGVPAMVFWGDIGLRVLAALRVVLVLLLKSIIRLLGDST